MKTKATSNQQGHTIMITLVVCLVLGVVLLGIIKLASNEGQMTGRSQNWNAVMPIVEAGIEEALTHLKHSPSNRAENGWTYDTSGTVPRYTRTRPFNDGFYQVSISTNWNPVIISRAGIRAPTQKDYSIFRTVRVRCTNQPLFTAAIEAIDCVTLSGNGITFNSYNSLDPNHSGPGGTYPKDDLSKVMAGGDVVCYGGVNSLNLGNADVQGKVKIGSDTTYTIGPNGSVGDTTWNVNGIQPGWTEEVEDTDWPPMTPPPGGVPAPRGSGTLRDWEYVLDNGFYYAESVSGSILVRSNAVLVVTKRLNLNGAEIWPNASLQLYVYAPDASLSGIANQSTDALHFMYFGMPSNASVSMSGNSAFCGVLYAPNAMLSLTGGGSDTIDFSGSIVARCVKVGGHYNFHFDEALRRYGSKGIVAASWDELSPWDEL